MPPRPGGAAFVLAAALANGDDTHERWRKHMLGNALLAPYKSARSTYREIGTAKRKTHEKQDRLDRAARQRDREARQREAQENSGRGGSSSSDNNDSDSGGSYPSYTGPRCYAPGGKTWKPC